MFLADKKEDKTESKQALNTVKYVKIRQIEVVAIYDKKNPELQQGIRDQYASIKTIIRSMLPHHPRSLRFRL